MACYHDLVARDEDSIKYTKILSPHGNTSPPITPLQLREAPEKRDECPTELQQQLMSFKFQSSDKKCPLIKK